MLDFLYKTIWADLLTCLLGLNVSDEWMCNFWLFTHVFIFMIILIKAPTIPPQRAQTMSQIAKYRLYFIWDVCQSRPWSSRLEEWNCLNTVEDWVNRNIHHESKWFPNAKLFLNREHWCVKLSHVCMWKSVKDNDLFGRIETTGVCCLFITNKTFSPKNKTRNETYKTNYILLKEMEDGLHGSIPITVNEIQMYPERNHGAV